jgi:3-phenylpropionate/trans-cinnamate dioxygenase ferredoxin component
MTVETETWVAAADVAEFAATDRKLVEAGGTQIVLFRHGGEFFALSAWCSHQRSSLLPGELADGEVECPHHGARFDLRTGKNLCLPAVKPVAVYATKVEAGKVYVKV